MNHFIISAGFTFIFSLIPSISALLQWKSGKRYQIFGLYWGSIAFWSFFVAFQFPLLNKMSDFLWGWFLHLGCILIPVLFFHVAVEMTGESKRYKKQLLGVYLAAVIFNFLNAFTPIFTFGTSRRFHYAYPTPALTYPLYFVYFVILVIWGTILLLRSRSSIRTNKVLFLAFLITHTLAYLGGMDNFLIMWDINIFPLYPYGLYLVTPYAMMSTLLLSQQELFRQS